MSADKLKDGLPAYLASLTELFRSGDHSDLVVTCKEGTSFKVHKAIVCSQSKFFANACRPGVFKEGLEGRVHVDSDEPDVVRSMLEYLYSLEYESPAEASEAMLFHTKMYTTGDFFGVDALKNTAKDRFESCVMDNWDSDEFVATVQLIYESTLSEDRGLRDTAAHLCSKHFQELMGRREQFGELLSAVGDLGKDICMILATQTNPWAGYHKYQCQSCRHIWADARLFIGNTPCPGCGQMAYNWDAYKVK